MIASCRRRTLYFWLHESENGEEVSVSLKSKDVDKDLSPLISLHIDRDNKYKTRDKIVNERDFQTVTYQVVVEIMNGLPFE